MIVRQRPLNAWPIVHGHARKIDVRERMQRYCASSADCAAGLADCADVLISCLFSDEQFGEVTSDLDALVAQSKPGAILDSHTTVATPTSSADASSPAIAHAPVSATAEDVAAGALTVLIGGADAGNASVCPLSAASRVADRGRRRARHRLQEDGWCC